MTYPQWGWLQLIAGALVFAAGLALFTGRMWARVLGVILVAISAMVNFTSLSPTRSLRTAQR